MRINYNMSAAIANKHLLGIEGNLSKTMERLSSGLKINHSKDNPAGMAISNKMQAQIKGLNRASQNASDGISVIQISDGALNETTNILQRMRELSVQAANDGTMSLEDKQAIQDEIDSLKQEVDRISTDTEYNTKTLLDGSLDTRVYTDHASRVQVSDKLEAGNYGVGIAAPAAKAELSSGADFNQDTEVGAGGVISINGSKVEILETDTYREAYEKIRRAAEIGEVKAERDAATGNIGFKSVEYGADKHIAISTDNKDLADLLKLTDALGQNAFVEDKENNNWVYGAEKVDAATGETTIETPAGKDMDLKDPATGQLQLTGFSASATVKLEGNKVTITDIGGVSLSFLVEDDYAGDLNFEVTDMGSMTLHIGANKDQNMEVRIPEVSAESLYIDKVDVTTVTGADRAIASFDWALAQVSGVRSSLGAYENRLEYSTSSLNAFEENMTGAVSRLSDADMAAEMTDYTHQNVLNQAAISVLTQANELPQQVLQILK